jgi:VWFA-related protein
MIRFLRLFPVILGVLPLCFADNLTYSRLERSVVESLLSAPSMDASAPLQMIKDQFVKAGCTKERMKEQTILGEGTPNLICTLPGLESGAVVIAAALGAEKPTNDKSARWATVSMLPLLAESLRSTPHRHSFVFVVLGGSDAKAAASYYLQQMSEAERKQIRAMIDLDQIGQGPLTYAFPPLRAAGNTETVLSLSGDAPMVHHENILGKLLPASANALKQALPVELDAVPMTAAQPFDDAYILALTISSAAKTEKRFDPSAYYDTYNLMCLYTLVLDLGLSPPEAPKTTTTLLAQTRIPEKRTIESEIVASVRVASPSANSFDTFQPITAGTESASAETASSVTTSAPRSTPDYKPAGPVFRATTRLVQVDVVVTDSNGKPVEGLKQAEFTVLQDGKAQQVKVFEAHKPISTAGSSALKAVATAPDTFTNFPATPEGTSWNIVMFDLLNTDTKDQQIARKQLVQLLRDLPRDVPVALFTLNGNQLEMVHAFTTDSGNLVQAASAIRPVRSPLLQTEAQRQQEVGQEESEARLHVPEGMIIGRAEGQSSTPSQSGVSVTPTAMDAIREGQMRRQQQAMRDVASFQAEQRARFTMDAFRTIARAVSGYPGRKNLIWLSGSFPMQMDPDTNFKERTWWNTADYQDRIRQVGALIAASRVAVYPVDVRGLNGRGVDISTTAKASESYLMPDYAVAFKNPASPDFQGALLDMQAGNTMNELASMRTIADQTGGHAFVNGNDVELAIAHSIENGGTYYTLAYTPENNQNEQSLYHRLQVKLDQPGVTLSYRRGYYSEPPAGSKAQGTAALQAAIAPGMPQSTMVYLSVVVRAPDEMHKAVRLAYRVNSNGVTFAETANGKKHVQVECLAIAYDTKGHEAKRIFNVLDSDVDTAQLESVMSQGLPVEQEMELPSGQYNVRVGVMDRATQRIGTVDVPLVVSLASAAPLGRK